ncbi:MAG: DNA photolyase family protein [Pseudoxanthomonas sp.]|jgi:deoxyribodipyrimidine photo-lyase|uniref:cryptochrome/photolyase family protein n=1 Tax=Pseudoxanthomonas TaxID=83618 RepID=UPI00138A3BF5|nr:MULTISPECIES: deoxyribodipyrimidine photo-lyase [Pseudoxanthomonas]KAF1728654.1 deoxyribodipyrimidine photolyase [Pseudoxanthomonas mexicana]MCH2092195.1 DNA photolyase family protein [Pseudoxanthomonas sp.]
MPNALVWFRHDLRLDDNPALRAALDQGFTPIPVYVHAPQEEGEWSPGAASLAWLHRSLAGLDADLRGRGSRLLLREGPSAPALQALVEQTGAVAVFWNRKYEPATQPRDASLKKRLREQGLQVESCNGCLLFEPWDLATQQGGPYKVFTPFWRSALAQWRAPATWDAPGALPAFEGALPGESLDAWRLAPALGWDAGFWKVWTPGEAGAREALEVFIDGALNGYRTDRDRPDRTGTSRLSPHLHFGEIAPWRITAELERARTAANSADMDGYIRELGWREFAYHLLHHFPQTTTQNLNPRFAHFDWAKVDPKALEAWQRGRTGVPIVDAGLRELWATGYMHNRVRMIVASYLTKHLRYHWLQGARWFWDTLVDADLANNTLGWQWTAGTGADAAPYFRVFNPVTQAEKFDPKGTYIAHWVPELAAVPVPLRFAPWEKPDVMSRIAPDYPRRPLVDLAEGREGALAAYRKTGD